MPTSASDVILVTEIPDYRMAEGFLEFELTSGTRKRVFRISQHKARSAIHLALRVLAEAAEQPSNVRSFVHKAAKERPPRHHR